MARAAGGGIWIGTRDGSLSEFREDGVRAYRQHDGFLQVSILSLLSDRDGALWIDTDGAGLGIARSSVESCDSCVTHFTTPFSVLQPQP